MNALEYKGYLGVVEFDNDAGLFHGEVVNLRDVITFQGDSVAELRQAFVDSVEDYLDFCAQRGENPEKPLSGRLLLRLEPDLHRKIYVKARIKQKSINRWVADALERAVDEP
jgi:predicted HicB family RNase H-like nuclease